MYLVVLLMIIINAVFVFRGSLVKILPKETQESIKKSEVNLINGVKKFKGEKQLTEAESKRMIEDVYGNGEVVKSDDENNEPGYIDTSSKGSKILYISIFLFIPILCLIISSNLADFGSWIYGFTIKDKK